MKTTTRIKADVDNLQFGYWNMEAEEFVPISGMTTHELEITAASFRCSELLLDALMMFADTISEVVGSDLRDIWHRLEN